MSKILDDLMIYKQYTELIYYTEMITDKFPKHKNYTAWSKKITNIGNLLGGWIKSCQKR